jgi:hypothetical protein
MPEEKQTWMDWLLGRKAEPSKPAKEAASTGSTYLKERKKTGSLEALQRAGKEAAKRKKFDEENRKAVYGE